jgi:hypothetical protein
LPFTATSFRFYFDSPPLAEFVERLAHVERTLVGEAKLGQLYEDSYVSFTGDGLGHVTVSGLLVEGVPTQRLQFSFTTDQTALGPFIADLQRPQAAHAT